LNLNRSPGFSFPELLIHYRTPALPKECERSYRRSVAVSVGVKLRGRPGILSIGREFRPVEWLTFVVGFKAKGPERRGLVRGIAFSEKLPCTEKLIGHVRYRVTTDSGRLLRERIAPFRPSFGRCSAAASVGKVRFIHAPEQHGRIVVIGAVLWRDRLTRFARRAEVRRGVNRRDGRKAPIAEPRFRPPAAA
jgi:hypothetical protein